MNAKLHISSLLLLFCSLGLLGQTTESKTETKKHDLNFKAQLSAFSSYNETHDLPVLLGGRYIPQLNYSLEFKNNRMLDLEYSINAYGNSFIDPFTESDFSGKVKNYRAWIRYSSEQFELRAGLQKINFGSANMLRPLMWFDQIDPRDPLRLTDGVWGILARYYFLNNANLWLWGLYGNKNVRGWEVAPTKKNSPEFGGRFQLPIPKGEAALSYHHRKTNYSHTDMYADKESPENKLGLDLRFDMVVGWWLEGSWTTNKQDLGPFKNQEIINAGLDYTFPLGNGLYVIYEQLLSAYDEKAFGFQNTRSFSLLNMSYPIGMFDQLSTIFYYDWKNNNTYSFINWQKQFDNISLHIIGYWNPKIYQVPTQNRDQNIFGGKGLQVLFVFNH